MKNLFWVGLLLLILTFFSMGRSMYDNNVDERTVYNISNIIDNSVNVSFEYNTNYSKEYIEQNGYPTVLNIVYKFVDFGLYSLMELVKFSTIEGYRNPQLDYRFFVLLLFWLIIIFLFVRNFIYLFALIWIVVELIIKGYNKFNLWFKKH